MEDMWNLRASMNKSSGQPSPGSSTLNQFDMNPGQLSQPYVAQEVCVIERTIRQEPVVPNLMNFGPQGLSPNKLRSELLAMVSGVQQQSHRPSYPPSSSYMSFQPQFPQMNSRDSAGLGGWPVSSPNLLQSNRVNGKPNPGVEPPNFGQGRDLNVMTGGGIQETQGLNGLRTPGSEILKQSYSRTHERGVDVSWPPPSPQWLTEIVSRNQRFQSVQASNIFTSKTDLHKTESFVPDMGSGVPNQSRSVPGPAPSGRVFCPNIAGSSIGGELCLTDAGRLGIICTCHGAHMSVAKFSLHAGVNSVNPGEAVFLEGSGGENLVQWRKMFFTHYKVKVPEDNVGWEWLDVDSVEAGQGKYKAVMTQSWQKEVDVSYGGNTPMLKSRTTQVWDASLANGINPLVHATQSVSNTKFSPLNTGQGGIQEPRDVLLKNFGRAYKGGPVSSYFGASQFYPGIAHQDVSRSQGSMGGGSFHSTSHLGDIAMNNEYNFINDGGHRYLSPGQQATNALRNVKGLNYPLNRWNDGQEPRVKENDNSSSSFELRLGQPSQQSQPAGASFSSLQAQTMEHPKSRLFEQIMSRVWDGKLQHDLQQYNPAELPRFSGNPGQGREVLSSTSSRQPAFERTGYMESSHRDGQSAGEKSYLDPTSVQSARRTVNLPQSGSYPDAIAGNLQAKFSILDCGPDFSKQSQNGDFRVQSDQSGLDPSVPKFVPHTDQLRRSVTLENGISLDSLSRGALVHLSNRTGQRLLDTAIHSSYGYRAMALESPANANNGMNRRGLCESQPGDLGVYGRPSNPPQVSLPNLAMQHDVQEDTPGSPHRGMDTSNFRQLHQGQCGGVHMREQGPSYMNHFSLSKSPLDMHEQVRGKKGGQPSSEEFRDWSGRMNGKHAEEQGHLPVVNDKRIRSQSVPGSDNLVDTAVGSKIKTPQVQSSELNEGQGGSKASGTECHESDSQPLSVSEPVGTKGKDIAIEEDLVTPTEGGDDIHCTCYKCRKASPSTTGRAVPRLAGQICLKEKGVNGSKMETAQKKSQVNSVKKSLKRSSISQNQQKNTEPHCNTIPAQPGNAGNCIRDPGTQLLPWNEVQGISEEHVGQLEAAQQSEPLVDIAAHGPPSVADNLCTPKALSDIRSKSSEIVLSGLSDEACDNDGEGGASLAQSSGKIPTVGVLDECSGIGKCSSSDGVDMALATNPSGVFTLEDPSKRESPSSLGCPSSNIVTKKLIMKRSGPKLAGNWHVREGPETNILESEPALTAGKLEKKRRRTMKWKKLDSDVGTGEARDNNSAILSGRIAGPKLTVEKPDVGIQTQKTDVRVHQVKDRGLSVKGPAETEPLLKRRRVALNVGNSSFVPEAKEREPTDDRSRLTEGGASQRKVGTLVIRVPQGLNRQKAKRAIRAPISSTTNYRLDACDEALLPSGEAIGSPVDCNLTTSKVNPVNRTSISIATGGKAVRPSQAAPSPLTKNLRSVRTPLGGPSPRNGRMVSLSVIMKQPAEPGTDVKVTTGSKEVNLKADMTKLKAVPKGKPEGTCPKKLSVSVGCVAIPPGKFNEVKDYSRPELESPWKKERTTRVLHKEDARKVRSLWELTGKNSMPGPGAEEVFEFAEEGTDISNANKHGTTTLQTDSSIPRDISLIERPCPFPRSGRSVRSVLPNKRIVEWHRSKDAAADAGKNDQRALVEEKLSTKKNWTFLRNAIQPPAAQVHPRPDLDEKLTYVIPTVSKQIRSSKVKKCRLVISSQDRGEIADVRVQKEKVLDLNLSGTSQVRSTFAESGIRKRASDFSERIEGSAKRLRLIDELKRTKEKVDCLGKLPGRRFGEFPSDREFAFKRVVCDPPSGKIRLLKKGKSKVFQEDAISNLGEKDERKNVIGTVLKRGKTKSSDCNKFGPPEKSRCDVCGTSASVSYNRLLCCYRCPVKVHQACYGVSKIPKGPWSCRTCKFSVVNPVCVLCGYGGGAMTRVQKSRGFCQTLLQVWRELDSGKEKVSPVSHSDEDDDQTLLSASISMQSKNNLPIGQADEISKNRFSGEKYQGICNCGKSGDCEAFCKACNQENLKAGSSSSAEADRPSRAHHEELPRDDWKLNNTIKATVEDAGAKQWAHMVCTLWMPGTRCLNMGTMGVFDVSNVAVSRRKSLCSICQRKGGSCIQCRVSKCSTPFHVWCAHKKGLLQSETVQDGTNQVGFFGKCCRHGNYPGSDLDEDEEVCRTSGNEMCQLPSSRETCARAEGYKGRQTLEERAKSRQQMALEGSTAVTPEQVAAWLRINDRKSSTRRFIKPANSVMKYDHREYLRFKQKKGWKRLAVYKSAIHALGLYTSEFIAEGEVVVEYIGEIVGLRVADKREAEYHSGKRLQYQGACYLFRIDTEQIIDATRKGGIARFVNHSCSPNCVAKVICVDNLKKVIFFANRDIYAGEEVTYDYKFNYDEVDDKIPCFCGSSECRGTLN